MSGNSGAIKTSVIREKLPGASVYKRKEAVVQKKNSERKFPCMLCAYTIFSKLNIIIYSIYYIKFFLCVLVYISRKE
jgi:hypothetical protein